MSKPSVVMFEQVRTVNKTRLGYKFGSLTPEIMKKMERPLMISLGLIEPPIPKRKTVTK
ncbi:mRNA interferase MazF [compost metagenome]